MSAAGATTRDRRRWLLRKIAAWLTRLIPRARRGRLAVFRFAMQLAALLFAASCPVNWLFVARG